MDWKCEECKAVDYQCKLSDNSTNIPNNLCPYSDPDEQGNMEAHWFTNCATCGGDGTVMIVIDDEERERDCAKCKGTGKKYTEAFYE